MLKKKYIQGIYIIETKLNRESSVGLMNIIVKASFRLKKGLR